MTRKLLLPLIALCAIIVVAPATASARPNPPSAQAAYTHKGQDRQIHKLRGSVKGIGKALKLLLSHDKSNGDTLATIIAGVPAIVDGLTQLKDGLTKLASAYRAVEYGGILAAITLPAAAGGTTSQTPALVSADIPDDGNPISVSGQIPINLTPVPAGAGSSVIRLRAAIRSNETDGAATGDPAGQVGALLYAICGSAGGCGGAPAGTVMCSPVQTPASTFTTPVGDKSLNLINIQVKDAETDTGQPSGGSADPLAGQACTVPSGALYIAYINAQFVDIPTSLTPGPTD